MRRGRAPRAAIHERLAQEVEELRERLGGLPRPVEAEEIWKGIWIHEAHNSTAIEGNTLVLREVERLLGDNRAVGSKELKDYLEVRGYADAARWVYGQGVGARDLAGDALLTLTEVRRVHAMAMTPVWDVAPHPRALPSESPGSWREHDIQPFDAGMRPPPFTDVPALVQDWVADVCRLPEDPAGA